MTKRRNQEEGDVAVVTQHKTAQKLKRPKLYKVLLHNDDFTTMEFVVAILQGVFHHSEADATAIMLHIHRRGVGVAGVFTYSIAETKVAEVMHEAEKAEFPLLCTMEPDEVGGEDGGEDHPDRDRGSDQR
jgi:ATP-dependent Clp protease adaptor protein ClpS